MSFIARLSMKVVTKLEYENEETLARDIYRKMLQAETEYVPGELQLLMPPELYCRKMIRRKRAEGVHANEGVTEIIVHVLAKDSVFDVLIGEEIQKNFLTQFSAFAEKLSNGTLRLGDNTTLGLGACYCCNLNGNEVVEQFKQSDAFHPELFSFHNTCDKITISAHTETGILIRDYSGHKKGKEPVVNEEGYPIVPASTWKGIFRNSIKDWVIYLEEDVSVLDEMFGNNERGIKGQLIFHDSLIENVRRETKYHVPMDKFTGGRKWNSGKKREYIEGNFNIEIECLSDIKKYESYIATVLRDFMMHRINVGADFGIGQGFIEIDEIKEIK